MMPIRMKTRQHFRDACYRRSTLALRAILIDIGHPHYTQHATTAAIPTTPSTHPTKLATTEAIFTCTKHVSLPSAFQAEVWHRVEPTAASNGEAATAEAPKWAPSRERDAPPLTGALAG